jgi:diguanylate cyclase (GGDEF)-like protein
MVAERLCRRLAGVAVACWASAPHGVRADDGMGWRLAADTVFRPAVLDGGAAGVLLPLAMAEDRTGFLWEGGEGGLGRWDGYSFRLYTDGGARPDGLADHHILSLHSDRRQRLWVGTVSGGLARYDPATDQFAAVPLDGGTAGCVWSMDDDGAGGLWVGTDKGLFHLDGAGRVLAHIRHGRGESGLPADKVESVLLDRHGVLWAGGPAGLARGTDSNMRFAGVALPTPGGGPADVAHLLEDSEGRVWISARQDGAYVIDAARGPAVPVAETTASSADGVSPEILAMEAVGPELWLGISGHGILAVDRRTMRVRHIRHDPFVPGSLPKDTVSALYRDRSGLLWAGTVQGLTRYDSSNAGILTLLGDPGRRSGLRLNDAASVMARPDGALWVGSEDNGAQLLRPPGRGSTAALPLPRVLAIAPAPGEPPAQAAYLGTRAGLYLADPAGTSAVRIDVPSRNPRAQVNALLAAGGTLWLGGGGDGLWALRPRPDGSVATLRHIAAPDLTNDTLNVIEPAPGGRIAVGTDHGFNLLDPATGAVERMLPDPANPEGLKPGAVMCFTTDRSGRLWIGTDSTGIAVLMGRDGAGRPRFRYLGRAEGLPDLDISKLLVDARGMIWASTDHGLARIDPERLTARALQSPQGVVITSYWSNAGDITPGGELVFGGAGGLTIVEPEAISEWQYRPPVAVTSVKVGGAERDPGAAAAGRVLDIAPDANSLAVEFSALDFSAPELNRYAYRLQGFDRGWVETDATHRTAAYTNLPPGDYVLRLRGSNRDGSWSEAEGLPIRVEPAWYQSQWFRVAEASAALLCVAALVRWRTMILRQRQRELERQVAERTAELRASQKELEEFAYLDPLTSLPNRRAFNEKLARLVNAPGGEPFSLVLVDLDGFKSVNDQLGHQAGDAVLTLAADRIRHAVRARDFTSRLGGDEFAILVRHVEDPALVDAICARIVAGMAMAAMLDGTPIAIGASAGAVLYPVHGRTEDELYKHVDLALYEAKRTGRGTWCWYGGHPAVPAAQRLLL